MGPERVCVRETESAREREGEGEREEFNRGQGGSCWVMGKLLELQYTYMHACIHTYIHIDR